jgi:hypothetical protein
MNAKKCTDCGERFKSRSEEGPLKCPVHPKGCYASCDSCGGGGWVHIDFAHGKPDGVYNCDCGFGQSITHELAMERHAEQCGCEEYGLPKSDEVRREL